MAREILLMTATEDGTKEALKIMGLWDDKMDMPISGVSPVIMEPGSAYEEWPVDNGGTLNTEYWSNTLMPANWSDRQIEDARDAFRVGATPWSKPSLNARADSQWCTRNEAGGIRMFESSAEGKDMPERPRMRFAV